MIVFESDEIQVLYEPADSDFLLITYGTMTMRADGTTFFAQPVTQRAGISALGFMPKRDNWYPAAEMRIARGALDEILQRHKQRLSYGSSMGAYAAIKYSGLFDAQTCLAFSPQYSIDPKEVEAFDPSYSRFFSEKLHAGMAIRKEDCPRDVFVFYDNKHPYEIGHMGLLRQAIDPVLITVPYTGHGTIACFRGSRIATTLFEFCRNRKPLELQALARTQRKPHPVRAVQICYELSYSHPVWADQILQRRAAEMSQIEVLEIDIRVGRGASRLGLLDLAERSFVHALSIDAVPNDNRALSGLTQVHFQRGDLPKAVELARQAVAAKPADVSSRSVLGYMLMRVRDLDEARLETEAGLAIAPDHVPLLTNMSNIAEAKGDLEEALSWTYKAIALAPKQLYLREHMIRLHMRREDWTVARREATALVEQHPSHAGFLLCLADVNDRAGRPDEAVEWMGRLVATDPRNVFFRERMAHLHIRANDLAAAEQALMAALDVKPLQFSLLCALADVYVRQNRPDTAMEWMCKAFAVEPDNAVIAEMIVNHAVRLGDFQTATGIVTGILARDPNNTRLMLRLADAYEQQAGNTQATEWLRKAIAVDPTNVRLLERLVNLSLRRGDFAMVRDVARQIIDLDPHNTNMMCRLSDAHERLQELSDAVTWAQNALATKPSDMFLRERLAHMLIVSNDLQTAEQLLLANLDNHPAHFGSLRYMADIMLRRRRFDQAVAYAERATEADPAVAWFRDWYAGLLLATGDADAADIQIRESLRLVPDNQQFLRRSATVQAQLAQPRPWMSELPNREVAEYFQYWQQRHMDSLQTVKAAQPRVLFMGDSITEQWNNAGTFAWNQYFAPLGGCQNAISNERTQTLLWRIENGAIDGISPGHVVLLIGTNNIGRHRVADVVTGVEQVWTEIQTRLPDTRLVALAILPRDPSPESWHRLQVNQINDALTRRAAQRGIPFFHLADCLLEPDGTLSPEIAPDGIHLSTTAYQRIAPRISQGLTHPHPNAYSTSAV